MSRFVTAFVVALGFLAIAAHAQNTTVTSTTKTTAGEPQTITYTGCVKAGTEAKTYILDKILPVSRTTTTGATGTSGTTVTTTTTYMLVPDEKVVIQENVGHKVEVTGMMIPETKTETTTTKVDRDNAPDTKTVETVKTEKSMAQFRVMSIKSLADSCQ